MDYAIRKFIAWHLRIQGY